MPFQPVRALAAILCMFAIVTPAPAAVHLMQIEQVIGGVNGDPSAQAVQLRLRSPGQSVLSLARLVAYDAAGQNPVILVDMTTNVSNSSAGARVLVASPSFATNPSIAADYIMTNTIPASYLAAGSLTFEDDGGTIYWRLCWGGAAYTGSTAVAQFINDDNGDVAPPFALAMPSTTLQSLRFPGAAGAGSTNNAADYALSARGATFINNANQSGVVIAPPEPCPGDIVRNGSVDVADLLAVIAAWGPCVNCPASACPPDVAPKSGDCNVNVADLLKVITSWGACP